MILGYPGIPLWPAHNPLSSTLCPPCGDFRGCHGGEPLDHKVESLMTIRFENFSGEQGQLDLIIRIDFKNEGFLLWSSTGREIKGANGIPVTKVSMAGG